MNGIRAYPARLLLAIIIALAVGVSVAAAQETRQVSDDEVNQVARDMYCPTCENMSLDTCPTQACADWRAEIREQLAEGRSKDEIMDYFAARYGNQIRSAPPREGFHLLAWLLPLAGVLIGAVLFGRYLLNLQQAASPAPAVSSRKTTPSDQNAREEYLRRLEQELKE